MLNINCLNCHRSIQITKEDKTGICKYCRNTFTIVQTSDAKLQAANLSQSEANLDSLQMEMMRIDLEMDRLSQKIIETGTIYSAPRAEREAFAKLVKEEFILLSKFDLGQRKNWIANRPNGIYILNFLTENFPKHKFVGYYHPVSANIARDGVRTTVMVKPSIIAPMRIQIYRDKIKVLEDPWTFILYLMMLCTSIVGLLLLPFVIWWYIVENRKRKSLAISIRESLATISMVK